MCDGRRLKKRKTSTKRNTLNPVYNEAIVFDVPPENIEQISLLIAVMDYDRLETFHIHLYKSQTILSFLIYTCCRTKRRKWFVLTDLTDSLSLFFSFHTQDVMHHYFWNARLVVITIFSLLSLSCAHSVGHNEVIGVCRVGNDADSLGRDHWSEMLTYPRKPVAHWHPLVEVRWCYCDWCDVCFHACMRNAQF